MSLRGAKDVHFFGPNDLLYRRLPRSQLFLIIAGLRASILSHVPASRGNQ